MKYEIISNKTGCVYVQYGKSIADMRKKIGHADIVIRPVIRKGNQFDLGGKKQCWRKHKPICIVDSRPNVMIQKMGL